MDALDPVNELAALIRGHLAQVRPGDPADVVAERIRAIPAADPDRERKAFRLFLETVLVSEFGTAVAGDPSFAAMVDHVQQQMEADPQLAQASRDAARLLLKSAGGA